MKELNALQDQIYKSTRMSIHDESTFIKIKLFDSSQMADEQIKSFLNLKTEEIRQIYQSKLDTISDRQKKLEKDLENFRECGKKGNYTIPYDDMNLEFLIKMVHQIEHS